MRYISTLIFLFSTAVNASDPKVDYKHIALGTWEISEVNFCPNVCSLDDKQASSFKNTIIEFGEFSAKIGNETCDRPSYVYRYVATDDFVQGNRFYPSDIGLSDEKVIEVSLLCGGSYGKPKSGMASRFYIKNQSEIIVGYNGVKFLTRRLK